MCKVLEWTASLLLNLVEWSFGNGCFPLIKKVFHPNKTVFSFVARYSEDHTMFFRASRVIQLSAARYTMVIYECEATIEKILDVNFSRSHTLKSNTVP